MTDSEKHTPDGGSDASERDCEVERDLTSRFDVAECDVKVAGHCYTILRPTSPEDLISEEDFERDERLPYWADLWPSAHVLAREIAGMPGNGRTMLELGCGLGLVSVVALRAGWNVLATDYYDDALLFALANAQRNGQPLLRTANLDWRALPDNLSTFDLVVASDVLYERPYAEIVARVLRSTLRRGGEALIADPGRLAARDFVLALEGMGMRVRRDGPHEWRDGDIVQQVTIIRVVHGS
ncbi:MAG TPA: methyltransferase [Gemmatimonadales bacterium]|nr:methyltransferase [Gemmatimonadales bacterium]